MIEQPGGADVCRCRAPKSAPHRMRKARRRARIQNDPPRPPLGKGFDSGVRKHVLGGCRGSKATPDKERRRLARIWYRMPATSLPAESSSRIRCGDTGTATRGLPGMNRGFQERLEMNEQQRTPPTPDTATSLPGVSPRLPFPGVRYCLINPAMPGYVKIGFTTALLEDRLRSLDSTGVPPLWDTKIPSDVRRPSHGRGGDRRSPALRRR